MKFKDSFHPYAMITIFFWSLAFVYTRLALQHFSALSLGFTRYAVASITLLAVAFIGKVKPPKWKDIPWFLMSGAAGFFFYMITFNIGSQTVTASTSSIILATGPVITALLARVLYKEKLKNYQWAAVAVEFVGILALTLIGGSFSTNMGVLWLLGSALLVSTYNLIQRKITKSYTALQSSAYSIFAGTLMLAIFAPAAIPEIQTAPPIQFLYVGILGVFSSAVAYVAWSKAFAKAEKTTYVSNYMFVTPFLTSLMGFLIAGEVPSTATVLGGVVIMSGVLLFNKANFFPVKTK